MYSEDMTGHAVIGEAAVNLAVREQEITVDSLLTELGSMLESERLHIKAESINSAIAWLGDFRTVGTHSSTDKRWMILEPDNSAFVEDNVIRLQADDDETMR